MTVKYGKTPARINSVQLNLSDYFDHTAVLPKIPAEFGHERLVTAWEMLANNQVGDCVWAGAAHETMLWGREAGRDVKFTDECVLADYTAVTGFDPSQADPYTGENPTDQGTDMQAAASYRRRIGIVDTLGNRHQVAAYVALTPGDPDQLAAAAYVFGAVGIGLRVPAYAEDEFSAKKPWDVRHGNATIVGGHYVPVISRRDGNFDVVTWGAIQQMTPMFYRRYCDEAIVYFSREFLTADISPEGFDLAQLQADLKVFARR
ncbi:hypothetical protein NONO_c60930 [Nocardia nova SH22a]|uniref:Uncharacterized protein n=1 Tax=Nocardia nova SH22a TaxID=1415166 RepID=W5TP20_9NOCA|nr:hypothetical protein [Nocardia nova]AHH20869.1 hypothetical protein NONO_c60930 [Nocardia nova SH22a]